MTSRMMSPCWHILAAMGSRVRSMVSRRKPVIECVYVETSSKCNLACRHCYRTLFDYTCKNKLMPLSLLKKIIDGFDLSANRPSLFLHAYGEPTLNPELAQMISYATGSGKFESVQFVSNLLAVNKEKYDEYFAAGLTELYISLDSMDQRVADLVRGGTDVHRLLDALRHVSSRHADRITVISVLSKDTREGLLPIREFLKELGVKRWNIQLRNTRHGVFDISETDVAATKELLLRDSGGVRIGIEEARLMRCTQPFTNVVFNVDGWMTPCCSLTNPDVVNFGNIAKGTVGDLYYSPVFRAFRKEFVISRPKACRGCPYWGPAQ